MFVFLTSCGQSQTDVPEAYINSEFKGQGKPITDFRRKEDQN